MSRWGAAGLTTGLVHGGLALLLLALPVAPLIHAPPRSRTVELTFRPRTTQQPAIELTPRTPPPAPPAQPTPPSQPAPLPAQRPALPARAAPAPMPAPAPSASPSPSDDRPGGAVPGPGPGRVDLFPKQVLCGAVGCSSGSSQGPGGSPSGAGTDTNTRVREALAQSQAEADVRAGRVDPIWRDIERDAHKLFNPPVEAVVPQSNANLMVRQLLRSVTPEPAQNASAWLASNNTALRVQDSITALQKSYNKPAIGRTAIIEADVDAEGQVLAVRLVQSAGTRRVDDEALRAVERAVRLRPIRDPRGAVTARYALRAEVAVHIPLPTPGVESNNGAVSSFTVGITGTFDEVTRKASVDKPFRKHVETHVDLISVRPLKGAAQPATTPRDPKPAAP